MILDPLPIVSDYCDGAKWKGEPEQGFWCYDQPESPGPQKQKPQGEYIVYSYFSAIHI